MSRLWLAALGAAVLACGDDDSGGGPTDLFPDVAGVYAVEGQFDELDPSDLRFTGTITIEQESLESSLLTGTADITIISDVGPVDEIDGELLDASVTLAGEVVFRLEQTGVDWEFSGEKAGDLISGTQLAILGSQTLTGPWSGER